MLKKEWSVICLFVLVFCCGMSAQDQETARETESMVPELVAFHEVIYPMWHTAYPEKNFEMLRSFVPEINMHVEKIIKAELPGILRDKKAKWEAGLEELKKVVEEYNKAAQGEDGQALLDAAEVLHSKFEMLVRIIRPVLKEVDEFHKVLYVVYHKYLPDNDYEKIKEVCSELVAKAEAITKASLPKRLEKKAEDYEIAAAYLLKAAEMLSTVCSSGDGEAIEKAVESLHTKYQKLEKVFD